MVLARTKVNLDEPIVVLEDVIKLKFGWDSGHIAAGGIVVDLHDCGPPPCREYRLWNLSELDFEVFLGLKMLSDKRVARWRHYSGGDGSRRDGVGR